MPKSKLKPSEWYRVSFLIKTNKLDPKFPLRALFNDDDLLPTENFRQVLNDLGAERAAAMQISRGNYLDQQEDNLTQ